MRCEKAGQDRRERQEWLPWAPPLKTVQPRKTSNTNILLIDSKLVDEAVKRYIQEQEGKEIFEYSVFGSPQQKIGDFTQTKIGGF